MCPSFSDGGVEEERESMGNLGWDRNQILFVIDEGMTGCEGIHGRLLCGKVVLWKRASFLVYFILLIYAFSGFFLISR